MSPRPQVPIVSYDWHIDDSEFLKPVHIRLKDTGVGQTWGRHVFNFGPFLEWRIARAKNKLMKDRNKYLKRINFKADRAALLSEHIGARHTNEKYGLPPKDEDED